MNAVPGVLLILALPVLAAVSAAFSNPGGLLTLLVTRRQRYEHRHRLMTRRWRNKPRAKQRSSRISKRLRRMVLRADRGRCVFCGSPAALQIDHIVPWSLGGLTCLWNCAVLCKQHNLVKSSWWRSDSGKVYYRAWRGFDSAPQAALIHAAELAARRSVTRWLRAFGLLPSW